IAREAHRGLHREEGDDLEQVILDHVADRTGLLVEAAAPGDADLLGHGDLHARDVIAVPDRLEERVPEAEVEDVLYRLLAELVVDAKDRRLVEYLVQRVVERERRGEIAPEGLLDHDAGALRRARLAELRHDDREHARRDCEIVQGPCSIPETLAQRAERRALAVIPVDVAQERGELAGCGLIRLRYELREAVAYPRNELLARPAGARDTNHRDIEPAVLDEVVERRIDLAVAEITGGAEEHERV